ncbi:hypothetical protein [Flavobacterium suncheonense]|uniref:Uncharacterized protein n=1 Tax=Flavobacterium suncheonense GH29-5 = DSM 17707 TaxID=1121899 RepID=A0A0A2LZY9_9FLAO|nr:hypothetical protein [Flavobacterium suncheonense]KGO85952.1 hypothetical protein Q764_13865 [Flavobacterium suncheonense GH29-5 = DSM 17707]
MNDTVVIIIGIVIAVFLWKVMTHKSKSEIEEENRLKESLSDEFIYDPETGTKLTLEQAESGHWIAHNNVNRIKDSDEIEQFYYDDEKEVEELKNYIKKTGNTYKKLTNYQIELLEKTETLSKYDNWSYSSSFSNDNGNRFVLFPAVEITGNRHQSGYHESQIMFWIKDEQLSGHFYLREKTNFEKLTDIFRNDDDIKLDNYESFTIKKSNNMLYIIKLLNFFKDEKGLEFEIYGDNLFIKTLRFPNMDDYLRIEKIIKNVC